MDLSCSLLLMAQKGIPIARAYVVWTGIGEVGTFFLGILLFGELLTMQRLFFIALLLIGIIGLKVVSTRD